jgi:diacylglycerol kinase (ATP)
MTGVVVNPAAGRGRAGRRWPAIEAELHRWFDALEIRVTAGPGDATRLARELLDRGAEPIIAVGGDGVCNEVANAGPLCLGVLCVGSAGDFARTLGAPRDWRAGIEWLRRARPVFIDVGCAAVTSDTGARETRRFLNMASLGLGGRVVRRKGQPYLLAALAELRRGPSPWIDLAIDGAAHGGRFLHVAVGNGRYQGAAMQVCPRAELDDGWLDVTAIEPVSLLELALNLRKIYSGALLGHPKALSWRAEHIGAASKDEVAVELDGDPAGRLPAEFRIIRSGLRVLAAGL